MGPASPRATRRTTPHALWSIGECALCSIHQHRAVITDENGAVVATQQGYYPSFYVTAGQTALLQSNEMYLLYIYNVGPGCAQGQTCNVTILIQPAS